MLTVETQEVTKRVPKNGFQPGNKMAVGNRGGRPTPSKTEEWKRRQWDALSVKAIKRLDELMDSPDGSVALGATRVTLEYTMGKPRQQVSVDVKQTDMTALHLAALKFLAEKVVDPLDNQVKTIVAKELDAPGKRTR